MPECVHESVLQHPAEAFPLLIGKSRVAAVGLGILQINLLVGHVQVAAVDYGLAVSQPGQLPLGIGHIDRYDEIILIFCRNHAPLAVVLLHADAAGHFQGLFFREQRRP